MRCLIARIKQTCCFKGNLRYEMTIEWKTLVGEDHHQR